MFGKYEPFSPDGMYVSKVTFPEKQTSISLRGIKMCYFCLLFRRVEEGIKETGAALDIINRS